jgi:chemotaxis protein MotB
MALENQSVIVRKVVEEGGHGHHGGAWKVAYADFVTAMMAFFLLLWLLSTSSEDTLKGLAEFFSDAQQNRGEPGGVGGVLEGITVTPFEPVAPQTSSPFTFQMTVPMGQESDSTEPTFELDLAEDFGSDGDARAQKSEVERFEAARERQQFDATRAAIEQALEGASELEAYKDNIRVEQTPEGLRIDILDQEGRAMFPVGSDRMYPALEKLLEVVAKAVRDLPHRLSIRGHTDARPYAPGADYDNWRLSADRANASRRALVQAGVPAERIAEVIGKADTEPLVPEDPMDARNRRISIVLLTGAPVRRDAAAEAPGAALRPVGAAAELLPGSDGADRTGAPPAAPGHSGAAGERSSSDGAGVGTEAAAPPSPVDH